MAIAQVFKDFLLRDEPDPKYKGVRTELAADKLVTCIAVGLPLVLISLAFAQEVSVGTQISCFPPANFTWPQGGFVNSFCWASAQRQTLVTEKGRVPLWLHKFFPYILLLFAVLLYVPVLFWRFAAAPCLTSDLAFIIEQLDSSYNRAIKLAQSLAASDEPGTSCSSVSDLTEGFGYPLVEQYLKTKGASRSLLVKYLVCQGLTLCILLLACLYLAYYISMATITDEFSCDIRSGVLQNDTGLPPALQCKLVAVGVFQLLSLLNLTVYVMLVPAIVYALLQPARRARAAFLELYAMLPIFSVFDLGSGPAFDDLSLYLLFLEENLSELKSYKRLKVLEMLRRTEVPCDLLGLLRALGQVRSDAMDGRAPAGLRPGTTEAAGRDEAVEMKERSALLHNDGLKMDQKRCQ